MRTTVDALTAKKLQLGETLDRADLEKAQMAKIQEIVAYARENSPFYRERFASINPCDLQTRDDLRHLPFLTAEDVARSGHRMQCVSQSEVVRIITMNTSGSTGKPKRYSFTENDLAATSEFFLRGMENFVTTADRVLVLLPYLPEASVGELLIAALGKGDIYAEGLWPPVGVSEIAEQLKEQNITCVVGLPQQLLALAEAIEPGRIRTMLLCSDYAPDVLRRRIEMLTGCSTFLHYGATESGLGGGVECHCHDGVHLRESDLLIEVVDPLSGNVLPDGASGEVVLTTLNREAMPLIRYRTGDIASLDRSICGCGGVTARLRNIYGRLHGCALAGGSVIYNQLLDDTLFQLPGLLDYRVTLSGTNKDRLDVDYIASHQAPELEKQLTEHLGKIPEMAKNIHSGTLVLGTIQQVESFAASHTLKRTILDLR